jgi:hypothetical protein
MTILGIDRGPSGYHREFPQSPALRVIIIRIYRLYLIQEKEVPLWKRPHLEPPKRLP